MVERSPQTRADEQYPLLKVEGGGGDGSEKQQTQAMVSPGWSVTCSPKRSWLNRWPEFVTACWMTGILLGISFLVMYVLSVGAIRKQPVIILKCNNSKPASDVFYHLIVQRGSYVPFTLYFEYLADMALQYPLLHFNVVFLIDDSLQNTGHRGARHAKLFNRLISHSKKDYLSNLDEYNIIEMRNFQKRYGNVNITVISLSKYMALTPLRHKWGTIPVSYLPFYMRIFSVWQNGGIGIDLATFNNKFNNRLDVDRRISAIFQQHNDGIKPDEYASALISIERDEENEVASMFFSLINQMFNETRAFFNRPFSISQSLTEKDFPLNEPHVRTHRNKRDVIEQTNKKLINNNTDYNIKTAKQAFLNTTVDTVNDNYTSPVTIESLNNTHVNNTAKIIPKTNSLMRIFDEKTNTTERINESMLNGTEVRFAKKMENNTEMPKIVLFYDFSVFSDGIGPSYIIPEHLQINAEPPIISTNHDPTVRRHKGPSYLLSLDPEGSFIAASSRLHPFLSHLISSGCQRMPPKFAIQDALLAQCGGLFKDDVYCDNIYLL